jgi:hypothetical protein
MQILSTLGKVPGKTKLSMRIIAGGETHMVRVDVINMTRHVHHHFDYRKDGHNRKYNMHVLRNDTFTRQARALRQKDQLVGDVYRQTVKALFPEGSHPNRGTITTVYITREHDSWHIPYGTLYGITLITILRLGLVQSQREIAYHNFVALPLYEDMAPWNIVFQGSRMAYIDYDTKDVTYVVKLLCCFCCWVFLCVVCFFYVLVFFYLFDRFYVLGLFMCCVHSVLWCFLVDDR